MKEERYIDLGEESKPVKEWDRFYTVAIRCNNCGHGGHCKIPKGLPVNQYPCPRCLCQGLVPRLG